jgi:acid phosphatase
VVIGLLVFSKLALGAEAIPRPDHVVIVIEENKSFHQITGNPAGAPYINQLANNGALFTRSYAIRHPSQPNYLALFSGDTQGSTDDRCPLTLQGDNLASELQRAGLSFAIYSESMPAASFTGCKHEHYQRKHNPAANWQGVNVTAEMNLPFDQFPADYSKLPTISLVVPNQINDMHDGEAQNAIVQGDQWLKDHLDSYVQWASSHNSLLILTWDEDDGSSNNHIATVFIGSMVKHGEYDFHIDHYNVLRTLIDMYGLRPLGNSANAAPIKEIWINPG